MQAFLRCIVGTFPFATPPWTVGVSQSLNHLLLTSLLDSGELTSVALNPWLALAHQWSGGGPRNLTLAEIVEEPFGTLHWVYLPYICSGAFVLSLRAQVLVTS